jgi:hypothetical protein
MLLLSSRAKLTIRIGGRSRRQTAGAGTRSRRPVLDDKGKMENENEKMLIGKSDFPYIICH